MSTFYADIAKKKRAASGAYHKRGTKSRKVTLPSDKLTAEQGINYGKLQAAAMRDKLRVDIPAGLLSTKERLKNEAEK